MEKVNTIKYPAGLDVKLNSIVTKLGTNKRELLVAMVEYFYRTRKDPRDTGDELLKTTLNKNHKAYTGFIKSQENLLLIPIKEGVDRMIANQKNIVRYFNEQVLGSNRELLKHQQEQTQLLREYTKSEINRLKTTCLQLFDQYVYQREELGAFKGREREALADEFRKQVNKL